MKTLIFDSEVFSNYYLAAFKEVGGAKVHTFEATDNGPALDVRALKNLLATHTVVTFNGNHYDMPLLTLALAFAKPKDIKKASDRIINENLKAWQFYKEYKLETMPLDHIDLIEVAPGIASLKAYGGRLHAPKMQDTPVDFAKALTASEMGDVRKYCVNDLDTTELLYKKLLPQIELRETFGAQYDIDLRSKSDAQIAESVIQKEIEALTGVRPGKNAIPEGFEFKYDVPHWITFNTPEMQGVLEVVRGATFKVNNKGAVEMPIDLAGLSVEIGEGKYRMGIGGLHSSEETSSLEVLPGHNYLLDRDVASYYPNLILNCGLYPEHLGPKFLEVYRKIVTLRLAAKSAGDKVTSDTLKIVLNGTFGKLGNKYSCIYSPKLMIQVTLTGQLALLMLIEDIHTNGVGDVVSANTDGVTSFVLESQREAFTRVVEAWEMNCGLETEETQYKSLHSRDVNNYFAVKMDGSIKGKGVYADDSLAKSPNADICMQAAVNYITRGISVHSTVYSCVDIRDLVVVRAVKGGGMYGEEFLGKAVRWYYSTKAKGNCITYKTNGNKVAGSDGAMPCMDMPQNFPKDVDFDWYVRKSFEMLKELGVVPS